MTTETLNISEAQLVEYSQAHNEPSWLTELRKEALKLTETLEMPKPDKTKITRHSIQHGRYDPSRYKDTDFIKVILLIIATRFCTDIYHLD